MAALGPLVAGFLLGEFWWGSVFLVTLPLAAITLLLAGTARPGPRERDDRVRRPPRRRAVDHRRRRARDRRSASRPQPGERGDRASGCWPSRSLAVAAFVVRQRRAPNPLYDLDIAGTAHLLGRSGRRHRRVRLAHGRDVRRPAVPAERARLLDAGGRCLDPARRGVHGHRGTAVGDAWSSRRGARFTLLAGYVSCFLGFVAMLVLWTDHSAVLAGRRWPTRSSASASGSPARPPRTSLTSSVPVAPRRHGVGHRGPAARPRRSDPAVDPGRAAHRRVRRGLHRRDRRVTRRPRRSPRTTQSQLLRSYSSAEATAAQYPQYADQITTAAREAFTQGQNWAYLAGAVRDRPRRAAGGAHVPPPRRRACGCSAEYAAQDAR